MPHDSLLPLFMGPRRESAAAATTFPRQQRARNTYSVALDPE